MSCMMQHLHDRRPRRVGSEAGAAGPSDREVLLHHGYRGARLGRAPAGGDSCGEDGVREGCGADDSSRDDADLRAVRHDRHRLIHRRHDGRLHHEDVRVERPLYRTSY